MQGNAEQRSVPPLEIVERESGGPDVFNKLEDIVEHPAKKWTPKAVPEGENPDEWIVSNRVSGIVDYLEERTGDYGPYLWTELRQKDDSRIQVAGFGTVLAGWFPLFEIGDGVAISYRGTKPASVSGHKDFDDFDVVVVRNGRRVSRSMILAKDDEPVFEEGDGGLPMSADG